MALCAQSICACCRSRAASGSASALRSFRRPAH